MGILNLNNCCKNRITFLTSFYHNSKQQDNYTLANLISEYNIFVGHPVYLFGQNLGHPSKKSFVRSDDLFHENKLTALAVSK